MKTITLKERTLNDDILHLADNGRFFKGGYIAFLETYSFLNSWSDKKNIIKFKKKTTLIEYIKEHYPETFNEIDL